MENKKKHLLRLIQLAPFKDQERIAWTSMLAFMDEPQVNMLVKVLELNTRNTADTLNNTKK
jgi:glycopeptide antibiotics resistance protein